MAGEAVLALDQGTSNTKALLVDAGGRVLAQAARPVTLQTPRPGWAEQSPDALWTSARDAIADVVGAAGGRRIVAVALTNQRETALAWDGNTGKALGPAVSWQCKRSAPLCDRLRADGVAETVRGRSGLPLDPMFSAGKFAWLLDRVEDSRALVAAGRLRLGTVDSWLVWNLTGGAVHATEPGNASRTQLLDLRTATWDSGLCDLFGVPQAGLPELRPSDARFGAVAKGATALPEGTSILGVMGDSHAALFAHAGARGTAAKVTIGTGSSIMAPVDAVRPSVHGLSSTIAWSLGGAVRYAQEGNIVVSGHAATFAAAMLRLPDAEALGRLAATVPDSGGVVFVPALAGLGAPHWDDRARGLIGGLSLATTPAHLARATLEAIAHQIADVVEALEADLDRPLPSLTADGGASGDDLLLQLLADLTGRQVHRSALPEASAWGVARAAWEALGLWLQDAPVPTGASLTPGWDEADRASVRAAWRREVVRGSGPF